VLRSFPEAESAFVALDDYIKEVNFVGSQSPDGFSRVSPSLAQSLQWQWQRTTDRLIRSGALLYALDSCSEVLRGQIGQIIESYLMQGVFNTVYPWLQAEHREQDAALLRTMRHMRAATMADLGVRPEFQCPLHEAASCLRSVGAAHTPAGVGRRPLSCGCTSRCGRVRSGG
jgi:hypothetical protein